MADPTVGSLRRFAKVSSDCVSQAAQNLGVQTSAEVSSALVDDVSFRLRQVAEVSHAAREIYVLHGKGGITLHGYKKLRGCRSVYCI